MRQKKVKAIRRKIKSQWQASYATHSYRPANKDLEKRINDTGLKNIVSILGYAPLTCFLDPTCIKYLCKKAKRAAT